MQSGVDRSDARPSGERRLLLVELASTDRFSQYRAELYPFVRGYARHRGAKVLSLRFGFRPEDQPENRFIVHLEEPDLTRLLCALDDHEATHLLLNERLHPPQLDRIRARRPSLRVRIMADGRSQSVSDWSAWLGWDAGPSGWLVDQATPEYGHHDMNDLARATSLLVPLIAGPVCSYARPLAHSAHYADLDLSACVHAAGCSYCQAPAVRRYVYETPAVELALRQIESARGAYATPTLDFLLEAAYVFRHLEDLFAKIAERELLPCILRLACRIDELNAAAPVFDAWLPELARLGHAVHISNIGVENFSPAENDRFNKGISFDDVRTALGHIRRWEEGFAGTFSFFRDGGFGFITFTPWTTLGDLEINLAAMRNLKLGLSGMFLTSRLILLAGRPIVERVRRDGLLTGAFEDLGDLSVGGCLTSADSKELPWRFAHRDVAAIYSILGRLFGDPRLLPNDELASAARRVFGASELDTEGFVLALIEAARRHPDACTPTVLIDDLGPSVSSSPTHPPEAHADAAGRLAAAVRAVSQRAPRLLAGFTLDKVGRPLGASGLCLTFQRETEQLTVIVAPRGTYPNPVGSTERYCVVFRNDTPLDTPDKRLLVSSVVKLVERCLG